MDKTLISSSTLISKTKQKANCWRTKSNAKKQLLVNTKKSLYLNTLHSFKNCNCKVLIEKEATTTACINRRQTASTQMISKSVISTNASKQQFKSNKFNSKLNILLTFRFMYISLVLVAAICVFNSTSTIKAQATLLSNDNSNNVQSKLKSVLRKARSFAGLQTTLAASNRQQQQQQHQHQHQHQQAHNNNNKHLVCHYTFAQQPATNAVAVTDERALVQRSPIERLGTRDLQTLAALVLPQLASYLDASNKFSARNALPAFATVDANLANQEFYFQQQQHQRQQLFNQQQQQQQQQATTHLGVANYAPHSSQIANKIQFPSPSFVDSEANAVIQRKQQLQNAQKSNSNDQQQRKQLNLNTDVSQQQQLYQQQQQMHVQMQHAASLNRASIVSAPSPQPPTATTTTTTTATTSEQSVQMHLPAAVASATRAVLSLTTSPTIAPTVPLSAASANQLFQQQQQQANQYQHNQQLTFNNQHEQQQQQQYRNSNLQSVPNLQALSELENVPKSQYFGSSSKFSSSNNQAKFNDISHQSSNINNKKHQRAKLVNALNSDAVTLQPSTAFDMLGLASQYLMRLKPSNVASSTSGKHSSLVASQANLKQQLPSLSFKAISSSQLADALMQHSGSNSSSLLFQSSDVDNEKTHLTTKSLSLLQPIATNSVTASSALPSSLSLLTTSSNITPTQVLTNQAFKVNPMISHLSTSQLIHNSNNNMLPSSNSSQQHLLRREDICGRTLPMPQRRIIGGEGARYGEFPYQVHIKIAKHQCGGALVDRQAIVTAAHCVYHYINRASPNKLQIVIGAYDIEDEKYQELPPQYFKVDKVTLHPSFRFSASHPDRYDIAILKLDKPVKYTDNVMPVCLPVKDLRFENALGTVTGFGKTDSSLSNRYGTRLLQKVDVPIIDNAECERWHQTRGIDLKIFPEMMCAGYEDGLKDACVGDSGGPLVVKSPIYNERNELTSFRWTLAGITSAGFGCAQSRQPGIYHRVSHTVDWILAHLD